MLWVVKVRVFFTVKYFDEAVEEQFSTLMSRECLMGQGCYNDAVFDFFIKPFTEGDNRFVAVVWRICHNGGFRVGIFEIIHSFLRLIHFQIQSVSSTSRGVFHDRLLTDFLSYFIGSVDYVATFLV